MYLLNVLTHSRQGGRGWVVDIRGPEGYNCKGHAESPYFRILKVWIQEH